MEMGGYIRKFSDGEKRHRPRRKAPEAPVRPDFAGLAIEGLKKEAEIKKSRDDAEGTGKDDTKPDNEKGPQ